MHFLAAFLLFMPTLVVGACGDGSSTAALDGGALGFDGSTVSTTGVDGSLPSPDVSASSSTSGVPGNKQQGDLTDDDKRRICDWTASLYGGYGRAISCPDTGSGPRSITAPESQTACLAQGVMIKPGCTVTVAETEACLLAIASCDDSTDAMLCAPLFACYVTGP
jgi:hypothetical protein